MKKVFLFFFALHGAIYTFAQQVPIGAWRTHLPYNQVMAVDASANEIYCGTTGGIFTINQSSGEISKLSTIDGLAAVNISKLAYNQITNQILIAYANSNLDLLSENKVYHLPEIFDKQGLGNKIINAITFNGSLAYLSCGFGIVVYDLAKREVKDTYYIGAGGSNLEIYQIAVTGQNIYAAAADGVYQANINNPLLVDYRSWIKHAATQNYPGGFTKSIVSFNSLIYGLFGQSIYKFNGNSWQLTQIFGPDVKRLKVSNNSLVTIADFRIISYNQSESMIKNIQNLNGFASANDVLIANQNILIADGSKGLVKTIDGNSFQYVLPNGPNTTAVQELRYVDGKILMSPGAITPIYSPAFNNDGFSVFDKEEWTSLSNINNTAFQPIRDIVSSTFDAASKTKYLASYFNGVIEVNENGAVKIDNQNNSSLQTTIGDASSIRVNGIILDKDNNLWVSQYGVNRPLSVKKPDGTWTSYAFSSVIQDPTVPITGLTIDFNNQKWLTVRNSGIIVFDGSKVKKFAFTASEGSIPGTNVNCMNVDLDGALWMGTNQGVSVFYDTANIFSISQAEIPKVIENGFLKPLLGSENVNCIATDGANRKWIGTDHGVWLFSADGTQQIKYFNKKNSPLLDDKITSIVVEPNGGEVFIGTAVGIISYRGDATETVKKMNKITVYPNPVRPGFNGTIGIKGLSKNSRVKITNINGDLVYQTTANGGEAIWNGKNFSGDSVSSGVYLVLIVNEDGSDTAVSKILIVR
ncbi:MAG: T9SS type A sorting domain-containing protein [Bacteroidetes bacterium]|nr:T9SS type A sorting domain-containing protein [Bacteroidota bacterium]MBU1371534.1 T9SS type A sorting domain-containing protein [Bacteroidota bacterium]MBU1485153.1 T9SS type A sorting domain-containing protein [Bacteroidota bacterium]MBU1760372.1 T9SS type A sorting domain-containing protein [Bacteroidota bacterium]MBU2047095.1 T9SS type A sorting domain-containing protein [Bacteroidota bacterium]